ncbi:MAG: glycosyltransferase family 2 protein [Fibrella sp.]|nr:glycosyltransferase family 2 protein [Armatimonadota bacterium]
MRISVVIPSYNRETFVARTINSLLAQTRLPEEILVVDDGSQDKTASVIQALAERTGGRVRYRHRPNGGLSAARNTGTENAAPDSDAVLFLDSDDLLVPTALAKLEQALLAQPKACLAFCRARYINADDQPLIVPNTALVDEPANGDMWKHLLRGNCIRSAGGVLTRRDALNAVEPFDETMRSNEDWDMWLRLAQTGSPFARVPEPLLLYRIHGDNMSGNREVMRKTGLRVYEKQLERFAGDAERLAAIRAGRDVYLERDSYDAHMVAQYMLAPTGETGISYDAASQRKHREIRTIIERTGIANLYRRTPMAWRLRLRVLFGIDPNA